MYEFIIDPGHGWLKVPLADLPAGFEPTQYSFKDGDFAYLEEDCDAPSFIAAVGLDMHAHTDWCRTVHVDDFDRSRERFAGKS